MQQTLFSQFESYAESVIHADLRLMLPRLDRAHWEIATQTVAKIQLQFGKEGSGIIAEGAVHQGGHTVFVPMSGQQHGNGQPLGNSRILLLAPGGELNIASSTPHDWCSIFVPFDLELPDGNSNEGAFCRKMDSLVIDVGSEEMSRICRMLSQLYEFFRIESNLPVLPEIQKTIQDEVLEEFKLVRNQRPTPNLKLGRPQISRRRVLNAVLELLNRDKGEILSIDDLVLESGISERSLRGIFLDYFGVPPNRYLTIRRLHQVRALLRTPNQECTSVTQVAAKYGFWHLGRFANNYRRLFGELPSKTLLESVKD
ncbi:MAG: helix-turn-helix transcriptional regulator [Pirellula sp.]|jgi:AraC family ethanolamine operon transcriptional activator|nr:helix-turn-helix transcriptional regulator [Pirellula sp.]